MNKNYIDTTYTGEDENKKPEKEYTPIRKFYAWFGFISILICIGILPLLGEIEELREVVNMQKKVIEKAEEVINEQKVLLILKDLVITD